MFFAHDILVDLEIYNIENNIEGNIAINSLFKNRMIFHKNRLANIHKFLINYKLTYEKNNYNDLEDRIISIINNHIGILNYGVKNGNSTMKLLYSEIVNFINSLDNNIKYQMAEDLIVQLDNLYIYHRDNFAALVDYINDQVENPNLNAIIFQKIGISLHTIFTGKKFTYKYPKAIKTNEELQNIMKTIEENIQHNHHINIINNIKVLSEYNDIIEEQYEPIVQLLINFLTKESKTIDVYDALLQFLELLKSVNIDSTLFRPKNEIISQYLLNYMQANECCN